MPSPLLDRYGAAHRSPMDGAKIPVHPTNTWHHDLKRTGSLRGGGFGNLGGKRHVVSGERRPRPGYRRARRDEDIFWSENITRAPTVTEVVLTAVSTLPLSVPVPMSVPMPESPLHPATVRKRDITIQCAPRLT